MGGAGSTEGRAEEGRERGQEDAGRDRPNVRKKRVPPLRPCYTPIITTLANPWSPGGSLRDLPRPFTTPYRSFPRGSPSLGISSQHRQGRNGHEATSQRGGRGIHRRPTSDDVDVADSFSFALPTTTSLWGFASEEHGEETGMPLPPPGAHTTVSPGPSVASLGSTLGTANGSQCLVGSETIPFDGGSGTTPATPQQADAGFGSSHGGPRLAASLPSTFTLAEHAMPDDDAYCRNKRCGEDRPGSGGIASCGRLSSGSIEWQQHEMF